MVSCGDTHIHTHTKEAVRRFYDSKTRRDYLTPRLSI